MEKEDGRWHVVLEMVAVEIFSYDIGDDSDVGS